MKKSDGKITIWLVVLNVILYSIGLAIIHDMNQYNTRGKYECNEILLKVCKDIYTNYEIKHIYMIVITLTLGIALLAIFVGKLSRMYEDGRKLKCSDLGIGLAVTEIVYFTYVFVLAMIFKCLKIWKICILILIFSYIWYEFTRRYATKVAVKIEDKRTLVIGMLNIFIIHGAKVAYEWCYGYKTSLGELYIMEFMRMVIAVVALVVGIKSWKKAQAKKIWVISGIGLAIIEIIVANRNFLKEFLNASMEIIG